MTLAAMSCQLDVSGANPGVYDIKTVERTRIIFENAGKHLAVHCLRVVYTWLSTFSNSPEQTVEKPSPFYRRCISVALDEARNLTAFTSYELQTDDDAFRSEVDGLCIQIDAMITGKPLPAGTPDLSRYIPEFLASMKNLLK